MGPFFEGKIGGGASALFLDDANLTFNLPYMFLCCYKITCASLGHCGSYRFKLDIKQNNLYIIRWNKWQEPLLQGSYEVDQLSQLWE